MRYRYRVWALLFLLSVVTYLDRVCISVAGPRIQREFHLDSEQWGWVVATFAIAYAAFEIPGGRMADRFGPRVVLVRIVLWWSAFTAITGTVRSLRALLVARFCFGVGEAGAFPSAANVVSRWFPPRERGRVFGSLAMAMQTGGALSPLIVIPIQTRLGWRVSFYLFALLGIAWAIAWSRWFHNKPLEKAAIAASELNEIHGDSTIFHEVLPWRAVVRSSNFWAILYMAFAYGYGSYFFIAWSHTYLVRARHFTEQDLLLSSFPFVFGACANVSGGLASDLLIKSFGLRIARCLVGFIGLACAAVFAGLAAFRKSGIETLVLLSFSFAGISFNQPMTFPVCLDVARKSPGAMSGAMNTAAQIGAFVSGLTFGLIAKVTGSYDRPVVVMAFVLFSGALMWLRIDPKEELIGSAGDYTV